MKTSVIAVLVLGACLAAVAAEDAARKPGAEAPAKPARVTVDYRFEPDPKLPNVLILGDSISIGYTLPLRKRLAGRANVFRPARDNGAAENCSGTAAGVEHIERWLGDRRWDVIHFNWGLHDLKRVKPDTGASSSDPNDPQQATVEQYARNLERLADRLAKTGARLIFATTTPVAPGTTGPIRMPQDPIRYNAAALPIVTARGAAVNDLFAFALARLAEIQRPQNVHFTPEGSEALADEVARVIQRELEKLPSR